jgi:hypothetical protein
MPFVPIPAGVWTSVVVTDDDTVIQNVSSGHPIYITTEDTADKGLDEGLALPPGGVIELPSGLTIKASSVNRVGLLFYMEV